MSIDGDVTKKVYVNDGTSVQSTSASSSAAQTPSSSTVNTVFDRSNADENAKKLGLTKEEYMELLSNPEFQALKTPEEQINYIREYKAAKQTGANVTTTEQAVTEQPAVTNTTTAQPSGTEPSTTAQTQTATQPVAENAVQTQANTTVEQPVAENVSQATQTTTTQAVQQPQTNTQEETPVAEPVATEETKEAPKDKKQSLADELSESFVFDSARYSEELTPKQMLEVYIEEYAKNKFIYGDKANPKSIDDWHNLSEEERQNLIKDSGKEVRKKFKLKEKNAEKKKLLLAENMTKLQAANSLSMTYEELASAPSYKQFEMIAEHLDTVNTLDPSKMSKAESTSFLAAKSTLDALKSELKKQGISHYENISYGDIAHTIKKYDIKLGVALRDHLTDKASTEELNDIEKKQLKYLTEDLTPELVERLGIRYGETTDIEQQIAKSDYAAAYAEATSSTEKARILRLYANDEYRKDPEKIVELIDDASECGNLEVVFALRNMSKTNPKLAKLLAERRDQLGYNINDNFIVNNCSETLGVCIRKLDVTNKLGAALATKTAYKHLEDNNVKAMVEGLGTLDNTDIANATVERTIEIKDEDKALDTIKAINTYSSEETKDLMATNIDRTHENIQSEGLNILVEDNGERTKLVVENGTLSRMAVKAQTEGFKTLQQSLEKNLPEDAAIESLKALSDQISLCDASNQLDMHKSITKSIYEEVQTHAASNIHTYDKSVQAEAIKVTYESGNINAIEAANQQIDKCDPEAIQSIREEVDAQIKAMEERQIPVTANTIAEKLVQMDAAKDPAASEEWSQDLKAGKINEYKETFMKANPATKFRMISKLQGIWQKEIISHIARYCPEMLTSLITSMGSDLFQLQLTPEIRNKIMLEMLRVPDMQADALEYFKDNPNSFSSSIKDTCAELLLARKDGEIDSAKVREALHTDGVFMSAPETLGLGGKVSNREYYNKVKGDITFWKRDKYGNFIG